MSVTTARGRSLSSRGSLGASGGVVTVTPDTWVRPSDWTTLPVVLATDQKFVGLHAIFPDGNYVALTATGNYTVNWGDGVTENFASGVVAYHTYDYTTYDTINTTLSSRGYKQAIVTVTPQNGQVLSSLNLHQKPTQIAFNGYTSCFLDIALAGPYLTELYIGSGSQSAESFLVYFRLLERVNIVRSNLKNLNYLFAQCTKLQSVVKLGVTTDAYTSDACSFSDVTDKVTCYTGSYSNGDMVRFISITSTTGINTGAVYFVMNAVGSDFQVAATSGGAPIALTVDGTGVVRKCTTFINTFSNCWSLQEVPAIDTSNAGSLNNMFNSCSALCKVASMDARNAGNLAYMFYQCYALTAAPNLTLGSALDMVWMFYNCQALKTVPVMDTSTVTTFAYTFGNCQNLLSVPAWNTMSAKSVSGMFISCHALQSIPLLNTAAVTDFSSMFSGCNSLQTAPQLNTSSGASFNNMFASCVSLKSVPLLNTASGTIFQGMFSNCNSLRTIPAINTSSGTGFGGMFNYSRSLQSVPLLDTSLGTDFSSMFAGCVSLQSIPTFNTSSATNLVMMFDGCIALTAIPALATTYTGNSNYLMNFASYCSSLTSIGIVPNGYLDLSGARLSEASLTTLINSLPGITNGSGLNLTNVYGAGTEVSKSGTLVRGSSTVAMANTTGVVVGMQVTGMGAASSTGASCTFTTGTDLVGFNAHGLSNGDEVAFNSIITTTGIVTNTIYFVVNAATNNFQVAATSGGAALPLTTNGTGGLKFKQTVTAINPNVNITLSRASSWNQSTTLYFRTLKTNTALLKGWSISG